ncbi:MAG: MBL fold metallo-hydrolase [Anaerolineae bacterium]|jgi:L-ascorbate metabolism protein UlaG (beta-lactamase superfamily)|nr:MBL fold metallo-hydrolase [Anaerolineae bacterium]
MIEHIQWLGYGSFVIQSTPLIYINPWRVSSVTFLADVVLVSHAHFEHFSPVDIEKVSADSTLILSNAQVAEQLPRAEVLLPFHSRTVDRARITALPAYSTGSEVHKREDGGLGFLISLNFYDIYYVGDSEPTPEMRKLAPDILILPIDGMGTMTPESAADMVRELRPRYAIPCNWGMGGVNLGDAERFKRLVGDRAEVRIPEAR